MPSTKFDTVRQQLVCLSNSLAHPTNMYRCIEFLRHPLAEHRLEVSPYMVITYEIFHIWTYDRRFLVIRNCNAAFILYLRLRDNWHALINSRKFSTRNEIIVRQVKKHFDFLI